MPLRCDYKMDGNIVLLLVLVMFVCGATCSNSENVSQCIIKDGNLDCASKKLCSPLNDTLLEGSHYTSIIFDNNLIVHLNPFPVMSTYKLSFRNNSISVIDQAAFRQVKNLTELDLSHNHLTSYSLTPHIFMGIYSPEAYEPLSALKILRLSGNSLHTLHQDLFEHLPNLKVLSLDSNPIKTIDRTTSIAIASLLHLQVLDLSSTGIKELPQTMLHAPKFLETLNISNNQFTTVPTSLEDAKQSLKTLIFDNNPTNEIISFPALDSLEILHINYMPYMEGIGSGALVALPNLKELVITHNPNLVHISETALSGNQRYPHWPPLEKLYLNNNHLFYFGKNFIARWDRLKELDISMNPWICDCRNQWFLSTLVPQFLRVNNKKARYIMCERPLEMHGRLLSTLSKQEIEMRCLPKNGSKPEKDSFLLIATVFLLLLCIPCVAICATALLRKTNNNNNGRFVRMVYHRPSFDGAMP